MLLQSLRGLAVTVVLTASVAWATPFTKIVVFGDSLSDVGNEHAMHGNVTPPNYLSYRNSNGPLWVDQLAASLGEPPLTNSLSGGTDFAYGGATASTVGDWTPRLGDQVSTYVTSVSGHADPAALYVVWAGANDFLFPLATISPPTVGKSYPNSNQISYCQSNASTWAGYVSSAVGTLHAAGALNFLVPNLPPLGCTPALNSNDPSALSNIDLAVRSFNNALSANLSSLGSAHIDLHIKTLDVYSLLNQVVAHPSNYGFTNATAPCYPPTGVSSSYYNSYVFWDYIHPTTAAHTVLGNAAALLVPEPGILALTLTAAAMWLAEVVRYRRR